MDQDISIRMGFESLVERDFDATENDFIAFAKGVNIEAVANSQIRLHSDRR